MYSSRPIRVEGSKEFSGYIAFDDNDSLETYGNVSCGRSGQRRG